MCLDAARSMVCPYLYANARNMPTEYKNSGPEMMQGNNMVQPQAPIYFCEGCGYQGAPFGQKRGDQVLSYCGWRDGHPVCVGKGKKG